MTIWGMWQSPIEKDNLEDVTITNKKGQFEECDDHQ
jgi:hypothetical protein